MKKIATMQDLSGIGKCSLACALPVIASMGIETAILPTAVLSTHTMFKDVVFHDLTREIRPILEHWKKQGFSFDAVYTGYLGSLEQLQLAKELFTMFPPKEFILVDPCMADNGKLYHGFDDTFVKEMRSLCACADVICPNLTEACLLLEKDYPGEDYDEDFIQKVLVELSDLGVRKTILTGISFNRETLGVYAYDKEENAFQTCFTVRQPESFHGTGDLWASAFSGALLNGLSQQEAIRLASDFVCECIRLTLAEEDHNIYGTNFEQALPYLIERLHRLKKQ